MGVTSHTVSIKLNSGLSTKSATDPVVSGMLAIGDDDWQPYRITRVTGKHKATCYMVCPADLEPDEFTDYLEMLTTLGRHRDEKGE